MNVLFLARRFYPEIGGVEKHVLELSKCLIAKGHSVTIVSEFQTKADVSLFEKQTGITIIKIPVGRNEKKKKFLIWQWFWHNRELIKKADVIHCHDVFFWYLPFRFLFPTKPVFTTFHGYETYPIAKKAIIVRGLSERLSWGNICIGDFIPKWYGTKPTFVSYGAVDNSKFKIQNSKFLNESAVFIGRLDEQTGIIMYVKALEILQKKFPKFELTIVGDGKYKTRIQKNVKALGFKTNPEKYLQQYHFAFVSRYLTMLEAFAAKKLVFAVYDNPVKEDYLKMAPFAKFIFIENSAQSVAQRVAEILHSPQLEKKMVEAAYDWVTKQTWENMANLYLRLWKKRK